jgi:YVTN family beta-propeller protein
VIRLTILVFVIFCAQNFLSQHIKIDSSLYLIKTISGKISPKSIVHNGKGLFYAQNMMYRHTVTVYDRSLEQIATIKDYVYLNQFGFKDFKKGVYGGPVECAFSHNGKYAWVSNYSMIGGDSTQFRNPGCDNCSSSSKYDSSFVYQIDTETHKILDVVKVGAVPKYVATSPDNSRVVVSNWTSGDVSIIDTELKKEIKRISVGTFPRGIVIDHNSQWAYVTVMGSTKIAKINIKTFETSFIENVGKGPRHLCISPDSKWLYLTLNTENKIAKINTQTNEISKTKAGIQPRSMAISDDGKFLYVVNYSENTFSKFNANDLSLIAISKTKNNPIGITYDGLKKNVWVACYSGHIQVFKDSLVKSKSIIEIENEIQTDVLAVSKNKSSVAILTETQKEQNEITEYTEDKKTNNKSYKESNGTIKPISRLFSIKRRDIDVSKLKPVAKVDEIAEVKTEPQKEEKVIINETPILNQVSLNKNQSFLVIVGSFGDPKNADNLIASLKKKKIQAEKYFDETKQMTRVFVYSSDSETETNKWIESYLPKDLSFWILKN